MNFQELMQKMVELDQPVQEEKKADKDYDGDGKIESGKDEYMGSRMKAAEKSKEEKVDEEVVDECGMPGMDNMPSSMMGAPKQQDSVTMNVSMNGAGAGGIRDLMQILRNIEQGDDSGPEPERFGDGDMDVIVKKMTPPSMKPGLIDDDFANQPDEMYGNMDSVTGTGDDLHSKGKEAPKVNGGGNPMPVESGQTFKLPAGDLKVRLESLYQEIKSR